ncbi:MAG: hypothetical protein R3F33_06460 [Planctomycetota bacterium]
MKNFLRNLAPLALLTLLCAAPAVASQNTPTLMKMDFATQLDGHGDGEIAITMEMSAKLWADWKRQYGSNPSMLKRDFGKLMSQYEVTGFELNQDDMNRKAVIKIQAKGVAAYQGDDVYHLDLGKELAGGEILDGQYRVTTTEPDGSGNIMIQNQRITPPEGASDLEATTNNKGEHVLAYELPTKNAGLPWNWIGLACTALGLGLLFTGRRQHQA